MKNIINIARLGAVCAASLFMLASCDTDVESVDINQPGIESQNPALYKEYLSNLKAYKQSEHKFTFVGFNNEAKIAVGQGMHINAVPDSADYVILSAPEAINEREIKEMTEIREKKGTKSLYTVSFDGLKVQYNSDLADFEAQKSTEIAALAKELEDGKITQDDHDAKVAEIQARTFVEFKPYLADSVTSKLSYCKRYGFDGVIFSFKGKEKITMTEDEKIEYAGYENMFFGMVKDWVERNPDKEYMLQGMPQFYTDQSLLNGAKFIFIQCQSASSSYNLDYTITKACGDGVPTDKFVPVVETMSMDASDKVTGWWSGRVPASLGAAQFVATMHDGYTVAGLAIMNINNDYYNSAFTYPRIRTAISIMNTTVKN